MRPSRRLCAVLSHNVHTGGVGKDTSVWMHGIVGTKKNWRTCSKQFLALPASHHYGTSLVLEHRGHGESHGMVGNNTVENCASDLEALLAHTGLDPALVSAHSFGGKVALKYIERRMQLQSSTSPNSMEGGWSGPLRHVWVLDSLPGVYTSDRPDTANSVFRVLEELSDLPQEFESRDWAVTELQARGIALPVALWLGTSVVPVPARGTKGPRRARFGFDIAVIQDLFADFVALDMWPMLDAFAATSRAARANGQVFPTIHYLRAGKNTAWTPHVLDRFAELEHSSGGGVRLHCMPHVGHWLHTEDPKGMLELMTREGV